MNVFKAIILTLGLSSVSFAATTLTSVSGASDASLVTATDGVTTSWTITGGISGVNASTIAGCTAAGGACNTCLNLVANGPCNPAGVFADTILTFSGTTAVTGATNKWLLCKNTEEIAKSTNLSTNLQTTWGQVCTIVTGGGNNQNCATSIASTGVYFGAGVDCPSLASTEKVAVKFLSHFVDPTSNVTPSVYTDCPTINSVTGAYGACHFTLFPGDEKVYLEEADFIVDSTWPAVASGVNSEIKFTNIFFFFVEKLSLAEADGDAFARITTDMTSGSGIGTSYIPVADEKNLGGSFIDGLDNDIKYCFRMASQDNTKHIQYLTPTTVCPAATATCDDVCMMPSEVVGILSDKKCFIATAAYGSDMDEHVQMLRKFRNEYMAPFWIGRKLIKTYYKISPPFARWISDKENMKSIARGALWPIMGWAELALRFGWSVIVAPFLFVGLGLVLLRKRSLGFKKV